MGWDQERRYPVGVQTFEKIRTVGYRYVDKSAYVWRLAHESGNTFFLSRPRRFGKSLLVSTMQAYFEGRKDLFEGLDIVGLEDAWDPLPVLRIDLSTVKTTEHDELKLHLDRVLRSIEAVFGRDVADRTPGARLESLIMRANSIAGKQVVVLVDEYDAPLLNVVDDPKKLAQFRQVMREFFAPLKACDEYLRFVFLTGITKFSQLSIFSELNNMRNISMDPRYAGICGITEDELTDQLAEDVAAFANDLGMSPDEAHAHLRDYYDGYRFCYPSPNIYNPFSLMSAFAEGRIGAYWFGSGTPTALVRMMGAQGWQIADLVSCEAEASEFDAPTERMATPIALLYQSGYLTIRSYDSDLDVYTLGIPNREVSRGLSQSLVLHADAGAFREHNQFLLAFARAIRSGDIEDALKRLRAYLASIPYHLGSRDERGFETTFYLIFDLLGAKITTEFKTATGLIDAVLETSDTVYVMEFKYGKTARAALDQIDAKGYLVPFSAGDKRVVRVGVNFSPEEQTIDDWIICPGDALE